MSEQKRVRRVLLVTMEGPEWEVEGEIKLLENRPPMVSANVKVSVKEVARHEEE